jgi:UDP:flavonoid glycosyltransferase YjiC (YdhE family)
MSLSNHVKRPASILAAIFQGGGNIPLVMPVLARLVERGHHLRVIVGPGVRRSRVPVSDSLVQRLLGIGATLVPFRQPNPHPFDNAPPVRGLLGGWIPTQFRGIPHEAQTQLWAPAWADNVATELRRTPADIVIADFVLLGALAAAEAARVHCVALMHTIAVRPLADLPPYGTGWGPGRQPLGKLRDTLGRLALECLHRRNGLWPLNAARSQVGLAPLRSAFDQYDRASQVLMLVSPSFDFPTRRLPSNMRLVGSPIDDSGASALQSWWPPDEARRQLVVASLSTLMQGQTSLLRNILLALSRLDVRALVTLGPALDPADFAAPPNVVLKRFVPHSAVLPEAAVLVTQCGLGTLTKGLVYGVPLVCIPILGDQPDNAARVVAHGAGIRVPADASPEQIGAAIQRVLNDQKFASAARQLSAAITREGDAVDRAIRAIEDVLSITPSG